MQMRTGDDEAREPKYAHIERERRWLVDPAELPDLNGAAFILIQDRYIDNSRMRLRRMTDSKSGLTALKLSKKYECADHLARPIVTTYLTQVEFNILESLPSQALSKRRFKIEVDGCEFSYDCFLDNLAGLHIAEIEWPDDAGLRALSAPVWATRDVSEDKRYQGGSLVRDGIPGE
jgi:CYTH domain-containing protein